MAIQSFTLDPTAGPLLTDDQHVDAINAASVQITRAGSVSAAARPIEALEVDTPELAAGAVTNAKADATLAKDNLTAMAPVDRGFVATNPIVGEFPITAMQRDSGGLLDVEYDDVPIVP